MKAILIRVGVDQTFGHWNAPCNPETGDFVYVPIPQVIENKAGLGKYYKDSMVESLQKFSLRNNKNIDLPLNLLDQRMHLDPDFDHLSYGDTKNRGSRLLDFKEDDLVVFYSGMRSIYKQPKLEYGLIGMYVIEKIERVSEVSGDAFDTNAHTRYLENEPTDAIVRGKPKVSGRFKKYIPIGEFRNKSYRVEKEILAKWGGLSVNDGWIQRSVVPPLFLNPIKFLKWIEEQSPHIIDSNA